MAKPTYETLKQRVKWLEQDLDRFRSTERLGMGRDISQILDMAPYGLFMIDLTGKILAANKSGAKRLGKTVQEIIGTTLREYFPPHVSENRRLKGIEAVKWGKPVSFEDHFEGRWYHNTILPLFDDKGTVKGLGILGSDVTAFRLAEEALRESEEKYRNLIESLQEGIWVIDEGGKTVFVNAPMAEMLGYTRAEMLGRHLFEFMDEENVERAKENLKRGEEGLKEQYDFEFIRKDGSKIYTILETSPLMDKDGNYQGAIAGVVNVTERKQTEEALRKERDVAQKYLDTAGSLIMVLSASGDMALMNRMGCKILGYEEEQLLGKNFVDHSVPHKFRSEIRRKFQGLANAQIEELDYENPVLTRDGQERTILWRNRLLYDETGAYTGTISSGVDITERKRAEEALKESEEKYREMVENINDAIYATDEKGRITYISPQIESGSGFHKEDLVGKPFSEFIHPEDLPWIMEQLQERLAGVMDPSEYRLVAKTGEVRWVRSSSRPIYKEDRVIGLRGVLTDIIEKKRLEAQLMQAQKMEAVGTLAGGIAHDFNNLLMGIQGNASLMLLEVDSRHPYYENLKNIERYVQSGAELTKQLLAFGRGGRYEAKPTQINEMIQESAGMFGGPRRT